MLAAGGPNRNRLGPRFLPRRATPVALCRWRSSCSEDRQCVLLPKLHAQRCVLHFAQLRVAKNARRRAAAYELTVDPAASTTSCAAARVQPSPPAFYFFRPRASSPPPLPAPPPVFPHRGAPDAGCRGMRTYVMTSHGRLNALRLVTIECCLSRHMCGDGHRPSQLLQSRHSEISVSSSTRLETMTCYLQTLCLKTRKAVLPSVCLETTLDHVEIPCLKKPRDVSTMFHL